MPIPKPRKPKQPKQGETTKKKKRYKVRNWREYNQALVNRGSILFWLTEEAMRQWHNEDHTGNPGRPKSYSDTAITTALTIQQVFRLPLRQTEGLLSGILERLDAPVKVYGEGEWTVRQHGWSKRRTWKKLHIGVDETTGDILLGAVTGNDVADCETLAPLLEQLPETAVIDQASADGAFDTRMCYEALVARRVRHIAIPPQVNAKIWKHGNTDGDPLPRDANLRRIRAVGRRRWKAESHYHRRSLAETMMFRLKTVFTDRVSGRSPNSQRTQLLLRCRALNLMNTLGMPKSYAVA